MARITSLLLATALLAQPALAANAPSKAERDRQISEIIFQNYPPRALAAGEEGPVFFIVDIDKDARATSCEVTHGSGHPLLDAETCNLIVQHAVFKSARDASGRVTKQHAEGVVNWTIPGHTPAPIYQAALPAPDKSERQVCKSNVRTGTIASVERTCMTEREWAKQSDESKQPWEEMEKKGFTNEAMGSGIGVTPCAGGSFKC
jgi:protein TonB